MGSAQGACSPLLCKPQQELNIEELPGHVNHSLGSACNITSCPCQQVTLMWVTTIFSNHGVLKFEQPLIC